MLPAIAVSVPRSAAAPVSAMAAAAALTLASLFAPAAGCARVRTGKQSAEVARASNDESNDVEYRRGTALLAAGRPAEARGPLSRAVERTPGDASSRVALAACLGALGERDAAIEMLRDVPLHRPSAADADRAMRLARALTDPFRALEPEERAALEPALRDLERDAPGPASERLEQILAHSPTVAAAHLLSALAAERLGERARAFSELRKAAALAPEVPQPHAYLARLWAQDRPELAAAELAEAVKRNPVDPVVLRTSGELDLDRLGQPARAADSLGRAAALLPGDPALQILAARAELTAGSYEPGVQRLAAAVRARRGDPQALLRLATAVYDERTRTRGEAARRAMTRCIEDALDAVEESDPDNATARGLRRAALGG